MLVWADANFALKNYETITSKLAAVVPDISTADSILKWAIAERAQGIVLSEVQNQLAKNMEIRVWREDSSRCTSCRTLEIEPDYPLALKFAELNWQFTQSLDDQDL